MSRRSFLAAMAAAFVADPERLLWVPGQKLISIPKPQVRATLFFYGYNPNLGKSYVQFMMARRAIERGQRVGIATRDGIVDGAQWVRDNEARFRIPIRSRATS